MAGSASRVGTEFTVIRCLLEQTALAAEQLLLVFSNSCQSFRAMLAQHAVCKVQELQETPGERALASWQQTRKRLGAGPTHKVPTSACQHANITGARMTRVKLQNDRLSACAEGQATGRQDRTATGWQCPPACQQLLARCFTAAGCGWEHTPHPPKSLPPLHPPRSRRFHPAARRRWKGSSHAEGGLKGAGVKAGLLCEALDALPICTQSSRPTCARGRDRRRRRAHARGHAHGRPPAPWQRQMRLLHPHSPQAARCRWARHVVAAAAQAAEAAPLPLHPAMRHRHVAAAMRRLLPPAPHPLLPLSPPSPAGQHRWPPCCRPGCLQRARKQRGRTPQRHAAGARRQTGWHPPDRCRDWASHSGSRSAAIVRYSGGRNQGLASGHSRRDAARILAEQRSSPPAVAHPLVPAAERPRLNPPRVASTGSPDGEGARCVREQGSA